MSQAPCILIAESLGQLFSCSEVNGYTRIRTPFLYPDGDVIDIFYKENTENSHLTDLGESLRWLRAQGVSSKRSMKQMKFIQDICLTHNLELFKGMLIARIRPGDVFADVVIRIAQGALRVADLWFTMRTRLVESLNEEVETFFIERSIPYDRNYQLIGRSGNFYKPDFYTRLPRRSSLIYVLSTGSKAAAKAVTEHVFTSFYDLSQYKVGSEAMQFVSLFDDTSDVWSEENLKLLADVSVITRWTQPDELLEVLNS